MWHASLSYQSQGRPLPLDHLGNGAAKIVEREAKRLLAGAGTGPRRWEHGEGDPGVLHVRRRLSDKELALLPPGPPPEDSAGGGRLYRVRTVQP